MAALPCPSRRQDERLCGDTVSCPAEKSRFWGDTAMEQWGYPTRGELKWRTRSVSVIMRSTPGRVRKGPGFFVFGVFGDLLSIVRSSIAVASGRRADRRWTDHCCPPSGINLQARQSCASRLCATRRRKSPPRFLYRAFAIIALCIEVVRAGRAGRLQSPLQFEARRFVLARD